MWAWGLVLGPGFSLKFEGVEGWGFCWGRGGGGKVGLARILEGEGGGGCCGWSFSSQEDEGGGRMGKGVSAGFLEWGATRGGE